MRRSTEKNNSDAEEERNSDGALVLLLENREGGRGTKDKTAHMCASKRVFSYTRYLFRILNRVLYGMILALRQNAELQR